MRRACAVAALAVIVAACGEEPPEPPEQSAGARVGSTPSPGEVPTYERDFAFAGFAGDSVILVPWLMRTWAGPDSVAREAYGWLGRRGTWDAFYAERWATPPTRAPSRVLPHGSLRLLVQQDDVIDGILFGDGERRLELALGNVRSSWGGPRGESIELVQGVAYVADQRVEGTIVHMSRASAGASPPGGDWALLVSGDSLQLVLAADAEHGGESDPQYRAYADQEGTDGTLERVWTDVRVTWTTIEAFPPARRDVPVEWRITAEDGSLSGELARVSSDIEAGTGRGPLLPVRALYEVEGELRVSGRPYPVRGLLVHERR
ncbi:MAG: hypothetical protein AB7T31_13100 [Gemmatimonadales bacterium]